MSGNISNGLSARNRFERIEKTYFLNGTAHTCRRVLNLLRRESDENPNNAVESMRTQELEGNIFSNRLSFDTYGACF